jgi:hypothetical protein
LGVGGKKKFNKRSPHQLTAYHTSDRKAATTVGIIMGVFLGKQKLITRRHSISSEYVSKILIALNVSPSQFAGCHSFVST